MGACGAVCVVDHAKLVREVLPAFRTAASALLAEGRARGSREHEELCRRFERDVTARCISHFAIVGRTYRPEWTVSQERAEHVDDDTELLALELGSRGTDLAHASGGHGEGVLGWLDADECRRFAHGLAEVRPRPADLSGEDEGEQARRIALIRRVAALAVSLDRGLLWGIDLTLGDDPRGLVQLE